MTATLSSKQMVASEFQGDWYAAKGDVPRYVAYSHTKPIWIDYDTIITTETRRQADWLFEQYIRTAAAFKNKKVHEKRLFWQRVFLAAKIALYYRGCIVCARWLNREDCSRLQLQVIACAVAAGLLIEYRSPKGSPKMSRLFPSDKLADFTEVDPWAFDPQRNHKYVFLKDRETKEDKPFDNTDPIALKYQKRLSKINAVNSQFRIVCTPLAPYGGGWGDTRQLRPIHYALFADTFEQHGRLYTGRWGHQSLRKIERSTIQFELAAHRWEPSSEFDYSGFHLRMVYHLAGIKLVGDPYALWGDKTTPPMRLMAKTLVNAMLNADSDTAAYSECNHAMSTYTDATDKNGKRTTRKHGKALDDAILLLDAAQATGLKFKDMVPLVRKVHHRVADQFGTDAGMRLMRLDSELALRIMYHFAKQKIPCLGVHDSFIVPRTAASELKRVMRVFYKQKFGFTPVIK